MESQAFVWLDPRKPAETWVAPLLPATEPLMAWLVLPVCFRGDDPCRDQVAWIEAASDEQAQSMIEARSAMSTKPVYLRLGDEYRDVLRLAAQSQLSSSAGASSPATR
jgi:hypothetical protein